jgi:hypothetical protein
MCATDALNGVLMTALKQLLCSSRSVCDQCTFQSLLMLLLSLLLLLFVITNLYAGTVRSSSEQTRLSEAGTQCGAGAGVTRLLLILLQEQALLLLSNGSAARAASAAAAALTVAAAAAAAVSAALTAAAAAVTAVVRGWSCLQRSYFRVMLYH